MCLAPTGRGYRYDERLEFLNAEHFPQQERCRSTGGVDQSADREHELKKPVALVSSRRDDRVLLHRTLPVLMTIASLDSSITNVPHLMGLKGDSSCS